MKRNLLSEVFLLIIGLLSLNNVIYAQGEITVDYKTQRFVENESTFDRSKYIQAHFWFGDDSDQDFVDFKTQYNLDTDYVGSRRFWSPLGTVKNGIIPTVKDNYDGVRSVVPSIATGKPKSLFHDETVDYSVTDISTFSKDVADFTAQSFKDEWSPVPTIFEPFNEPMVHADEFYPGNATQTKTDAVITKMCEFLKDVGQSVHAVPELANMKVAGYASAWPEFENGDFSNWDTRYKKFIDIAGADMDILSVHLYDGTGLNNSGGRRSGSNSEAILDMIEAYSYITLGEVKPIAITEYGRLVANQPNWTSSNGESNYEPVENAQAVRSQLHMVMNFIERGGKMVTAIPFSTGKNEPTAEYSKAGLWTKNASDEWELTPRKYFFEIWKNVKGRRVSIESSNIDVQAQAFANGKQIYVVLNNLNDNTQTVDLNVLDLTGVDYVNVKRLKTFVDKVPEFTSVNESTAPANISLDYGETVVLTYHLNTSIPTDYQEYSTKYYASKYLQPIAANTDNVFTFDNVELGSGRGATVLRIGIGRDQGANLTPTVIVNGTTIDTSGDLIRGYDQNNRTRFFGLLEIPVDTQYLKEGTNTVKVKFSDAGGHISSAILQVEKSDKPLFSPSTYFFIQNKATSKYLRPKDDVEGCAMVQAPSSWTGDWVQWEMEAVPGESKYFYLKNKQSGRYFRPLTTEDGAGLESVSTSSDLQKIQWEKINNNGGWYYLKNRWSGMYFRPSSDDDISADTGQDFEMIQRPTENYTGDYTQWKFIELASGSSSRIANFDGELTTVERRLKIFPNPVTNGFVNLALVSDEATKISIFNVHGKLVLNTVVKQNDLTIDVHNFNKGLYILRVENETATEIVKMIVE